MFCKSGGRAVVGTSYAKRKGYTNKFIIMKGGMDQAIKEGIKTVPYNWSNKLIIIWYIKTKQKLYLFK